MQRNSFDRLLEVYLRQLLEELLEELFPRPGRRPQRLDVEALARRLERGEIRGEELARLMNRGVVRIRRGDA